MEPLSNWLSLSLLSLSGTPVKNVIESAVLAGQAGWYRAMKGIVPREILSAPGFIAHILNTQGTKVYLLYVPYLERYDTHLFVKHNR